jgi:hypothetical protein
VLGTGIEAGAINTLYILGLQIVIGAREEGISEEESRCSRFLNFCDIDEPIIGDNNSNTALYASNKLVNI